MQGVLFRYGPGSAHLAFKSTQLHQPSVVEHHLVLVGGLTDGLLSLPYAWPLEEAARRLGWTLVQAQLTSSYQGWGLASLDQDAEELRLLSRCLAEEHRSAGWVLMGHSTGCQDAVRYAQRHRPSDPGLAGVILQAPVSDREYLSLHPSWAPMVQRARGMAQGGEGEEVAGRALEWDGAALTARRLVSLACAGGDDDMFSTDLELEALRGILGPLHGLPTCIVQSGADESVPQALRDNGSVAALGRRMAEAIRLGPSRDHGPPAGAVEQAADSGGTLLQLRVVEGAGHACAGHEAELVEVVCGFLESLPLRPPVPQ